VSAAVDFEEGGETLRLEGEWRAPPREVHWFLPAEGRKVVIPESGVIIRDGLAVIPLGVGFVKLEVDLAHAHSMEEGNVPGLDELPRHKA
jgi:hypothetical protein